MRRRGGLSSLDKPGNRDKSVCGHSKWRLLSFGKKVQVSKQLTYFHKVSGVTAERPKGGIADLT